MVSVGWVMKLRSFYLALGAVVATVLAVSIGAFYWLMAQSPLAVLQGTAATPGAAVFVPKQAPVMVSVLVNPDRLEALRVAIARPTARRAAHRELEQLKTSLLAERQLTYDTDIKPWLGDEITLAVTTPDLDRDASNGRQPGYLLVLEAKDGDRARDFLQLFWQKQAIAGSDLVFEPFAGVKLIYGRSTAATLETTPPPPRFRRRSSPAEAPAAAEPLLQTLATTVVGDRFVLIANAPKVLREAINNVQAPGLNLSSSPAYQRAAEQLSTQKVGMVYLNLAQLQRWFSPSDPALTDSVTEAVSRPQADSLLAALRLNRSGLLAETTLIAAPQTDWPSRIPLEQPPVAALQFLPATTPILAVGNNLPLLWQELTAGLADFPWLTGWISQPLQALEAQWESPFSEDWLAWVDQGFALGLMPDATAQPDWIFAAQKTAGTDAVLAELDAIAQHNGFSIGPIQIKDQSTYAWTRLSANESRRRRQGSTTTLEADVRGVHTRTQGHEVFATSLEAMGRALTAPNDSMANDPQFQGAIAPLPTPNEGYLYLDWQALQARLTQRLPILQLAKLSARPLFDHVQSLTFSSLGGDRQTRHGVLFVRLRDR